MRKKRIQRIFLSGFLVLLLFPCSATALLSPYVDVFYINGDTGYEITGVNQEHEAWRSRLKFDVDNLCIGGGLIAEVNERIVLRLGGWGTLEEDMGKLSDKDWVGNGLVVNSSSNEHQNGWGIEGEFRYKWMRRDTFWVGPASQLGYDYFFFRVTDLNQWDINPNTGIPKHFFSPGIASTYSQNRFFFLIGITAEWMPRDWFKVEWNGFFSPITYVWDTDNHILRTKLAKGNALAFSFQTMLEAGFVLWKRLHIGVYATYLYLNDYYGEQDQRWYGSADPSIPVGTTYTGIPNTITRQNFTAGGRIKFDFSIF